MSATDLRRQSFWIYVRTLEKAYCKDAGTEVYQGLQDAPAIAMPVVLAQLKQKNKEWRCTQREWSHTWRQVDAHNFYKSLDYTGINFKQNDKETTTTKAFVMEIEGVHKEQEDQARKELARVQDSSAHGARSASSSRIRSRTRVSCTRC